MESKVHAHVCVYVCVCVLMKVCMHTGRRATQTIVPQKELVCFAIGSPFGVELTKYVGLVG